MPKIEDAPWNPKHRGQDKSQSVLLLESLLPGDTKRLFHDDATCNGNQCGLSAAVHRLRKESDWQIQTYHEEPHIMIVRRAK
jgi:hypothetical protein